MKFKDYLCEEYSWLDNFIMPNLGRPDKAIIKLAYAALMGPAIGAASGAYHALRTGNIGEVPRGIGRWVSGLEFGWDSPPAEKLDSTNRKSWWSGKTESAIPPLPVETNKLTTLISLLRQDPENPEIKKNLNKAIQEFVHELKSLPEDQKKALMIQLSQSKQ